jgi:hypothetical protein
VVCRFDDLGGCVAYVALITGFEIRKGCDVESEGRRFACICAEDAERSQRTSGYVGEVYVTAAAGRCQIDA